MNDFIFKYPGEDEESYIKRKAYFIRILKWRLNYGDKSVEKKLSNIKPIKKEEKAEIDGFWNQYFCSDLHDKFIDYRYYDLYNKVLKDDEQLCQYIPDTFYYAFIDEYYTNPQHSNPFDDKNFYDLYFHDVNKPRTIFRKWNNLYLDEEYNEITYDEAICKAKEYGKIILKIGKYSYWGYGVKFWDANRDDISILNDFLQASSSIVCQEVIKQHPIMALLNPCSVNTIRMVTFYFNNRVHLLSTCFRLGIDGAVIDNYSSGGIVCGVEPKGQLKNIGYDISANTYLKHPQGGEFSQVIIPNYSGCVDFVLFLAKRFTSITKLISWDIAVDEKGQPMLVEFGVSNGQVDLHQLCNGPIFGDLTDDVLKDVFNNSYTLKSIIKSLQ